VEGFGFTTLLLAVVVVVDDWAIGLVHGCFSCRGSSSCVHGEVQFDQFDKEPSTVVTFVNFYNPYHLAVLHNTFTFYKQMSVLKVRYLLPNAISPFEPNSQLTHQRTNHGIFILPNLGFQGPSPNKPRLAP
jgi:hypothetical protein